MSKIIYQSTKKLKRIFGLFFLIFLAIDIQGFIYFFLYFLDPIDGEEFLFGDFLAMIPGILAIISGLLFFLKVGVLIKETQLYKVYQLFGKTLKSNKLPSKFSGLTLLQFTYKDENEDGDDIESVHTGKSYQVFGLNENHSKRTLIFEVPEADESKILLKTLSEELNTPIVKYNPPAARRRKSRRKR